MAKLHDTGPVVPARIAEFTQGAVMHRRAYGKILTILFVLMVVGCNTTGTLPDEAKGIVLKQIEIFAGCDAAKREDCKEKTIRRAYEVEPTSLPITYQKSDAAWCVKWQVLIRHPINGNYYYYDDWLVILRDRSEYTVINAARGHLDDMIVCIE